MTTITTTPTDHGAQQAREPGVDVPEVLKRFIWDIQSMVELAEREREILLIGRDLMQRLVASDGWLPAAFTTPDPRRAQHFQLYRDELARFTVITTILAAGQALPVLQDQVWDITGVLQGRLERATFALAPDGPPQLTTAPMILPAGAVAIRAGATPDAVLLRNASADVATILIQVLGGEIGEVPRRIVAPDGSISEAPVLYANGWDAPPWDIHSIQTRIAD